MDGLSEGRIVHYVMPNGEHRPAMIVRVLYRSDDGKTPSGCCNLMVMPDGSNDAGYTPAEKIALIDSGINPEEVKHGHFWKTSVLHSDEQSPGTWHWPEQV